ncbi:hypothetical protein CH63R_01072 [Colletotrichum higginsianum IMI 349063]|uniref:Uncharacterized protein n=1 Tax=Colletotrichum higginsianum (strain IMI 349063) TaxID=759273 RepID=A0A1B7YVA8_COLHI|nr:hypothetical protein CH63R_01072 [Colletotrichum higginsianum IMI 349063]OBR15892.1 hypothetical protein CH63R_01072 [Colletotrichum higginsianum IMI 349063]
MARRVMTLSNRQGHQQTRHQISSWEAIGSRNQSLAYSGSKQQLLVTQEKTEQGAETGSAVFTTLGAMASGSPPLSAYSRHTGSLKSIHSAGAGRCSAPLLAWRGLKNPCSLTGTPQTGEIQFSTGAAHFLNFLSPSLLTSASTPSTDRPTSTGYANRQQQSFYRHAL